MGMPSTQVCDGGVAATQRRALGIARRLAALTSSPLHDAPGRALIAGRARVDAGLLDAEAVAHAACIAAGASLLKGASSSASIDSHSPPPLALLRPFTPAAGPATPVPSRDNRGAVHVVRVPRHLSGGGAPLPTWPEGVLPVFRGTDPEHFCVGGNPAAVSSLQSGAFLDGLPAFADLHDRLARTALPSLVVCHGATRGGGMLFPCLGTLAQHVGKDRPGSATAFLCACSVGPRLRSALGESGSDSQRKLTQLKSSMLQLSTPRLVLAHADATFGFPEVRRG
eukprot:scaffold32505_cov68-Phaeocystis_antarctica.AAC.1